MQSDDINVFINRIYTSEIKSNGKYFLTMQYTTNLFIFVR